MKSPRIALTLLLLLAAGPSLRSAVDASPEASAADAEAEARFVVSNTLWTLIHEMAHALISELEIPVLGQEEYAADQIASIALLHGTSEHPHGPEEAERLADAAEGWRLEWLLGQEENGEAAYWDNHPLDIQRYYNILCLIHAEDPSLLERRPHLDALPGSRALSCADYEHDQAHAAVASMLDGPKLRAPGKPARVAVHYEAPTRVAHEPLAALIRESHVAEHVADQTTALGVLPRDLTIAFAPCLGDDTAYWRGDRQEIVFCYDLLERFAALYRFGRCLQATPADAPTDREHCLADFRSRSLPP